MVAPIIDQTRLIYEYTYLIGYRGGHHLLGPNYIYATYNHRLYGQIAPGLSGLIQRIASSTIQATAFRKFPIRVPCVGFSRCSHQDKGLIWMV